MQTLIKLWQVIQNIGIRNIICSDLKRHIILTNKIAGFFIIYPIIFFIIFMATKKIILALICILVLISLFLALVANKYQKYNLSRLIVNLIPAFTVYFYACLTGPTPGYQLVLFGTAAIPIALYSIKEKFKIIAACSSHIAIYFLLKLTNYSNPWLHQFAHSNSGNSFIQMSLILTSFSIVITVAYLFSYDSYTAEKELLDSHKAAQKSLQYAERVFQQNTFANLSTKIAHEIRNPLTTIQASMGIIRKKSQISPELESFISMSENSIDKITKVTQLMNEYGNTKADIMEPVSLRKIIDDTLQLIHIPLDKSISIHHNPNQKDTVFGSAYNLHQVFHAIMTNAIESIESNGIISIKTSTPNDTHISIIITDDGHGISEKNIPLIYNPYFTTKHHNIGLGLSISSRIIHDHNGKISTASKILDGTETQITLPYHTKQTNEQKT